jgi:ribonuclease D
MRATILAVVDVADNNPERGSAGPEAGREIVWIDSASALARAAGEWEGLPAVALDTEFVRERTFFPRLGLIQVSDGRAAYLVDPLAVRDLSPLARLLGAPGTIKVLHSASEDIEVLFRTLNSVPVPLFDTQVASGLAGLGPSLSYQRLAQELLAVELAKGETRTDWLARPLSPAQRAYAAEDVAWLLPLYDRLRRALEAADRLAWALEDSAALLDTSRFSPDPGAAYLRLRGAGRLGQRQLAVLRELAAWRDREARCRDLPRSFVLRDELMLNLAVWQPATVEELRRLPALDGAQAARDGTLWLELVRQATALADHELPALPWRLPPSAAARELERRLRELVRQRAATLALPPEALASRRTLDSLLRSAFLPGAAPGLPRELAGWRRQVIGEDLLRELDAARV